MTTNLANDFELRAVSAPAAVALMAEDGRCWTFGGLDAAAAAMADHYRAAGGGPGDRVALQLPNSPDLVVAMLAAWKAGMAPVVMSGLYNQAEVSKCLAQVSPRLALSVAGARLEGGTTLETALLHGHVADTEGPDVRQRRAVDRSPVPGAEAEGIVLFTGGTTGDPKPVSLTHAGTYASMSNLVRAQKGQAGPFPLAPEDVPPNLLALPLFHSGGFQSLLVAMHLGRRGLVLERFSVDRIARLVPAHRIDNLFLLPTMIYDLVNADPAPDLSSVRRVLVAGQRLDPLLQQEFEQKYEVMVLSNYGSTELGHVAGWTGRDIKAGLWRPGAVGRVYDGVTVEIRAEDGTPRPVGEPGEVWVQSSRTLGYVDHDRTSGGDLLADGWIRSGDMGYLDQDRVLYLVGRSRELIKTGGFQVWPAELERVIRQVPGVADVAVVGQPDPRLGEIPVAVVVARPTESDPERLEAAVIEHCRNELAHYKAVRRVVLTDALPRSEAGKIRRDRIEAWLGGRAVEGALS